MYSLAYPEFYCQFVSKLLTNLQGFFFEDDVKIP